LVFELTFQEADDGGASNKVTMRYSYDLNRHLVLVEQKVAAKRFSVQWDRAIAVQERLGKLEALLSERLPQERSPRSFQPCPKTTWRSLLA
jgi:hypothetical protein